MKRSYKDSTIKKLFGLSGNICAYSTCNQELITSDNIILADICHIEGGEQDSPRYNPKLILEQLNDFDNLILMCKNHHKMIDSDETKYTVIELKNIKMNHEDKNKNKPFEITTSQTQIIYQEFVVDNQIIINKGEGNFATTHSGDVVQNIGLTISDVMGLFDDLFNRNFPKLREEAQKTAEENSKKFCTQFLEEAKKKLKPEDIAKLSDPDLQYILTKSIITSARKNEKELRDNISTLLIERIKNSEHNLRSIVYNESIETIGKLTQDELKIICLCFMLRYTHRSGIVMMNQLNAILKQLEPLLDFNNTNAEFQHIEYVGCGSLGIGSWSVASIIQNNYSYLLPMIVSSEQIQKYGIPDDDIQKLFTKENETDLRFKIANEEHLEDCLIITTLDETQKNQLRSEFINSKNASFTKIPEIIQKLGSSLQKVSEIVDKSSLKNLSLTSVGIVIGAMYYEKISGEHIDIGIWIK